MTTVYQQPGFAPGFPIHNMPMRHVFVVIGDRTIFLCHLINWWMEGHNSGVVLRVTLAEQHREILSADRKKHGKTHYLANPRGEHPMSGVFTLPWLVRRSWSPDPKDRRFTASVWRGFGSGSRPPEPDPDWLPWDADKPLLENIEVRVDAVVHYGHFNANRTTQKHEQYLLFGAGAEGHMYHLPAKEPDYDHVVTLVRSPTWLQADQLETGVVVSVPRLPWASEQTYCRDPFEPAQHEVLYHGIERYRTKKWDGTPGPDIDAHSYLIDVSRTWWFETRVLNWLAPEGPQCM